MGGAESDFSFPTGARKGSVQTEGGFERGDWDELYRHSAKKALMSDSHSKGHSRSISTATI